MTPVERINNKIFNFVTLEQRLAEWKNNNEKIVFTNGCFDILHCGHVDYLAKAKALGDRLVIGVNSDNSISRIKGSSRPIQDENSRLILLAAMEFVDAVLLFDDDTPYNLIKVVQPDILVKGADYKEKDIVGFDIVTAKGGMVQTITFLEGYSTTKIIEKILKN